MSLWLAVIQLLDQTAHDMTVSPLLAKVVLKAAIQNIARLAISGSSGGQKTDN